MPKGPGGVICFGGHMREPEEKIAYSFFDGQNLFRHAKDAFGHYHPNYDPVKLHRAICEQKGWIPGRIFFYTGIPLKDKDAFWHGYWERRILSLKRQGIEVITRKLRYRTIETYDENGVLLKKEISQEKGIDVRLALDVVRYAREKAYDVAILFSQDQDLAEVAEEVRRISRDQDRWIKVACAFPAGPCASAKRGIDKTDWIPMDQDFYDKCLDPRDYRP